MHAEPEPEPQLLTELAGSAEAGTELAYAWGLDSLEPISFSTEPWCRAPSLITSAVVLASLATVGAAATVAYHHLRDSPAQFVAEPATSVSTTTVVTTSVSISTTTLTTATTTTVAATTTKTVAPPLTSSTSSTAAWVPTPETHTKTVTVTPATDTVSDADEISAEDATFLNLMRADGWYITNPWVMTNTARKFCADVRQGANLAQLNRRIAEEHGLDMPAALSFTANAMIGYSGCRTAAGR